MFPGFPGFTGFYKAVFNVLSKHEAQHKVVAMLFLGFIAFAAFNQQPATIAVVGLVTIIFLVAYLAWSLAGPWIKARTSEAALGQSEASAATKLTRLRARLSPVAKGAGAPLPLASTSAQATLDQLVVKKPETITGAKTAGGGATGTGE